MPKHLLFYDNPVPVHSENHKDIKVLMGDSFGFASGVNSVPLVGAEFAKAALEFPIVFAGAEGEVMPACVLGMGQSGNVYVDDKGAWTGSYLPGFIRRYPFIFGSSEDAEKMTLLIDEAAANVGGKQGEALFIDGAKSPFLDEVLKFNEAYQQQFAMTAAFCRELEKLKLLKPMEAKFQVDGSDPMTLTGFQTVDREAFKGLAPKFIKEMFANDGLEAIYLHFASLNNFEKVATRVAARSQAA